MYLIFQSTLPLRGATVAGGINDKTHVISIHTPLAGSDLRWSAGSDEMPISIHTPLAGSDLRCFHFVELDVPISIHTPLAGSDRVYMRTAAA